VRLRWYTVVVDCRDVKKQAAWWAEALDWKMVYESDDECVIIPSWADDETARETPWERQSPGMVFVPVAEGKTVKNRLHIDLAPHTSQDRDAEIERLEKLGATRVDVGQGPEVTWTVLADPEGNEFCVLSSRNE
jgi:predicted enzyme related to lactoylglutathione lyase